MIRAIAIQKAIYEKLSEGTYKVVEVLPRDDSFPFIQIGEDVLMDDDTKTHHRTNHSITLHTWSKSLSSVEAKEMNDYVMNAMRDGFTVEGYTLENIELELLTTVREKGDNYNIFHGIVQYQFTLSE